MQRSITSCGRSLSTPITAFALHQPSTPLTTQLSPTTHPIQLLATAFRFKRFTTPTRLAKAPTNHPSQPQPGTHIQDSADPQVITALIRRELDEQRQGRSVIQQLTHADYETISTHVLRRLERRLLLEREQRGR